MGCPRPQTLSSLDHLDCFKDDSSIWSATSGSSITKSHLSRISSDSTSSTRTIPGLLNAPKRLFSSATEKLQTFYRGYWTCLVALVYAGLVFCALMAVQVWHSSTPGDGMDCEVSEQQSTTESRFHINLHAAKNLSFTQAKLIDLGWDIGVSHGGRLLHGWIFYHVAGNTITWILEYSALPYSVLLSFLFQPDSLDSLWSLVSSVRIIQGARAILKALLLATAVAHILLFTTIWSAATGYQNPQDLSFPMPDQSWATRDSADLRLCWLPDVQRPELIGVVDSVVLGPSFGDVFESLVDIDYNHIYQGNSETTPADYQNLFAYARSAFNVRGFLDRYQFAVPGSFRRDPNITAAVWLNVNPQPGQNRPVEPDIPLSIQETVLVSYKALDLNSHPVGLETQHAGLPPVIQGWQHVGFRQGQMDHKSQLLNVTLYTHNSIWGPGEGFKTENAPMEVARSDFHLDQSVQYQAGAIPYSSTLWYNGASLNLTAPFLSFKSCPWWGTPLGECLCYRGKPLTEEFRIEHNKACTGRSEYVWGFSYFITTVGLSLELLWCLICLYLWVYSEQGSKLAKYGRPTLGAVRNILDISEVLNEELGGNRGWHTEKQLRAEIKRLPEVGYSTREKCPGVFHVRLVAFPGGRPLQKQP